MRTVFGIVCDEVGHASNGGRVWATPAAELRAVQDPRIPIDQDHDGRPVGELVDLQRIGTNVWAVGEVDDQVTPRVPVRVGGELRHVAHPMFWSASRIGGPDYGFVLDSVALTCWPARVGAQPVTFLDGNTNRAAYNATDPFAQRLLRQANEARLTRHGGPIIVAGQTPQADDNMWSRQAVPIETRAATTTDVHVRERLIELIVIPYERATTVVHRGRRVQEIVSRGAFAGSGADRVRVNRDHDMGRVVGRAVSLDTDDRRGLLAELRIARTPLGDETLALADEGILDASAGFGVGLDRWERTDRRRVEQAWLHHIALTPDPAYTDARILAVRNR